MWFPVRKLGKKFWTLLIFLFVLSLGAQALGLVSVYFSGALIGAFLLLAVLLEGWRCGAILAVATPLTGWAIMGLAFEVDLVPAAVETDDLNLFTGP